MCSELEPGCPRSSAQHPSAETPHHGSARREAWHLQSMLATEHSVSLERDVRGAQALLQRAAVVAPGLLWTVSVPLRRRGSCAATVTTKTRHRRPRVDQDRPPLPITGIPVVPLTILLMLGASGHKLVPVPRVNIVPGLNLRPLPLSILIPLILQTVWHIALQTSSRITGCIHELHRRRSLDSPLLSLRQTGRCGRLRTPLLLYHLTARHWAFESTILVLVSVDSVWALAHATPVLPFDG